MSLILFSALKNEGPFLLEWVAHHLVVGFERIVLYHNDTDDGSAELIAALGEVAPVSGHAHVVPEGVAPQRNAARLFMESGAARRGDWVMWLDLDEYLSLGRGATLPGWLRRTDRQARRRYRRDLGGICLHWRLMGSGGLTEWPGRQIGSHFTACAPRQRPMHETIKTLFVMSDDVVEMDPHRPILRPDAEGGYPLFIGGGGQQVDEVFWTYRYAGEGGPVSRVPRVNGMYGLGQVNHYSVRTRDVYALRRTRGRGAVTPAAGVRHDDEHFERMDANQAQDGAILAYLDPLEAEIARLMAHPPVAVAHERCRAILADRIATAAAGD
ncbi:glycosyltransferase family 2 protein [Pontivivens ytuae]|uniref:Glycosyltransferase family 2 protein n=1 Tax=Pontivivens ytuae TaxID=2789856 RepID=A0A7S9LV09_9RHOB|nr:glycosyltransferase family 2 protein [Pontivivens ytuae]QPH55245.1 glycosyltransferase family 2 protein [Pontivivens ytuae]